MAYHPHLGTENGCKNPRNEPIEGKTQSWSRAPISLLSRIIFPDPLGRGILPRPAATKVVSLSYINGISVMIIVQKGPKYRFLQFGFSLKWQV